MFKHAKSVKNLRHVFCYGKEQFHQTVSKLKVQLYTTLGNHDIRENGRPTYTKLFGPPYYSFDYKNVHLVFLDSSRGWAELLTKGIDGSAFEVSTVSSLSVTFITPLIIPIQQLKFKSLSPGVNSITFKGFQ